MNDTEWDQFKSRLFTEYPSLHERLKRSAVDYVGTLNHWRKKLSRYSFDELNAVLDYWDRKNSQPWDGFAVEQAVAIIANVASKARDKVQSKAEVEEIRKAARKERYGSVEQVGAYSQFTSSMQADYEYLRPIHARMLAGEITQAQYFVAKEERLG